MVEPDVLQELAGNTFQPALFKKAIAVEMDKQLNVNVECIHRAVDGAGGANFGLIAVVAQLVDHFVGALRLGGATDCEILGGQGVGRSKT